MRAIDIFTYGYWSPFHQTGNHLFLDCLLLHRTSWGDWIPNNKRSDEMHTHNLFECWSSSEVFFNCKLHIANTKTKRYFSERIPKRRLNNDSYLRATDTYHTHKCRTKTKKEAITFTDSSDSERFCMHLVFFSFVSFHPEWSDRTTNTRPKRTTATIIITETR